MITRSFLRRHLQAFLLVSAVALACAPETGPDAAEAAPAALAGEPAAPRRLLDVRWDTLWTLGADGQDTPLDPTGSLAVDGRHLYLTDPRGARVVAIRREDGSPAWIAGRKGDGPGELGEPRTISRTGGGDLVVLDPRNARLAVLRADGRPRRELPLGGIPDPHAVCPLADGSFLVATGYRDRSLVRVGARGGEAGRFPLPWRGLDAIPSPARRVELAASPAGDECLVALANGRGFASIDTTGSHGLAHPYAEGLGPRPTVGRREGAGGTGPAPGRRAALAAAAVDGDDVVLAFEGRTERSGRLLDVHDRATGEYRHTLLAPTRVRGVARADGVYYVLTGGHGVPRLLALRPRPAP